VALAALIAGFAAAGPVRADESDLLAFEFTIEVQLGVGRSPLFGRMATDGDRHRIAIYWAEPGLYRDNPRFLRYTDFIFDREAMYYWTYGAPESGNLSLSAGSKRSLLPRDDAVGSILRSALAIVSETGSSVAPLNSPLEVGRFFRDSRPLPEYTYEVLPNKADVHGVTGAVSDAQIFNALPYGRTYSKETRSDGTLVWRARKALDGRPVVSVMVAPLAGLEVKARKGTFDPNTLGNWSLVPGPYRAYWRFRRAYDELETLENPVVPGCELDDRIASYLDAHEAPARVCRGLDRLRFKTTLLTGEADRVRRAAQAAVTGLYRDERVGKYSGLLELARMAGRIEEHYPEQAEQWLRPLVAQMAARAGSDAPACLDRLTKALAANKWFLYGRLVADEVRRQVPSEAERIDILAAWLEASRLARVRSSPDPNESSPSVKRYLAQLDAEPPRGAIDMNDLRGLLAEGLTRPFTEAGLADKDEVIDSVIESIRLIVGEGPFCGERAKLIESTERFAALYLGVHKVAEPIDTALATLVALSFCDTSAQQDHDGLSQQFREICASVRSQVNTMLSERGLTVLFSAEDVARVFDGYERIFGRYIDDPLWPAFKFRLTTNEEVRLANKMKLRLAQLGPTLDPIALKVEYGGVSVELKKKAGREISRVVANLMVETAFLRRPPYPGVSCHYRSGYGFTVAVKSFRYGQGDRPRKKFQAMKYFHMGHRLAEVVSRERDFARADRGAASETRLR